MEKKIYDAIKPSLNEEGIELVDVHFGIEDDMNTLFVVIDSEEGIDSNLCVKATHIVSPIIDELDLDIDNYVLDVGSKGVKDE